MKANVFKVMNGEHKGEWCVLANVSMTYRKTWREAIVLAILYFNVVNRARV